MWFYALCSRDDEFRKSVHLPSVSRTYRRAVSRPFCVGQRRYLYVRAEIDVPRGRYIGVIFCAPIERATSRFGRCSMNPRVSSTSPRIMPICGS